MPTITDSAVCIRHWDYSETSQTVGLLTREHGLLRGLAKGAKREKGAFSGGIDILTRGLVSAIVKPDLELATLTQWSLEEVFRAVRENLAANRAGLYMADLAHQLFSPGDAHPVLFDGLIDALRSLEGAGPDATEAVLLQYQWLALSQAGVQPQVDHDARTGKPLPAAATLAFSAAAGGTVADTGAGDRWRVRRETIDLLRLLPDVPADAEAETVARANRLLATYLREVIGLEPPAMRWAFPDLPGPGRKQARGPQSPKSAG